MNRENKFQPSAPLVKGRADQACRAVVIIPARNEEASIASALEALAVQVDESGQPLEAAVFEILLLLNNCTDGSVKTARAWKRKHPEIAFFIIERLFPRRSAHVGTARRLLMDTAWHRLQARRGVCGILSTDADTVVAPDWIAQNLCALGNGAEAVGGVIRLKDGDLERLPAGARRAYTRDRRYQRLIAELEDMIDPQAGDPWPRHLEHFGASLACTPEAYARAGGIPPVRHLEDIAFVDALRRTDARLRHEPAVAVSTSSRLDGRAGAGLSHQLRLWQEMHESGEEHLVPSCAYLLHRFRMLRDLRRLCAAGEDACLAEYPKSWRKRIAEALARGEPVGTFLGVIDCDRLIDKMFRGEREARIERVNLRLAEAIRRLRGRPRETRETRV